MQQKSTRCWLCDRNELWALASIIMKDISMSKSAVYQGSIFRGGAAMFLTALALHCWTIRPVTAQIVKSIAGTWQGTIEASSGSRIVLKISEAGSDTRNAAGWKGIFYNIDHELQGRVIASITVKGNIVDFAIASLDARYEGELAPDGASISGTWRQGNASYVLNFVRPTAETAWEIPEAPKAMAIDADPAYDVVTIKPSDPNDGSRGFQVMGRRIRAANETMNDLISFAYEVHATQIAGGPPWFRSERFYIDGVPDTAGTPNLKQFRTMIQKLLSDRFSLRVHNEQRELSVYALSLRKGGAKIAKSLGNPNGPPNNQYSTSAWMRETNATMAELAAELQNILDKPVVDQTRLTGRWDVFFRWTPDESQFGGKVTPPTDNSSAPPGLFTAIQEQTGLKLQSAKEPAEVVVVDHVERPSPN
jgi:uncharacterized protein (TIGR03435 family)